MGRPKGSKNRQKVGSLDDVVLSLDLLDKPVVDETDSSETDVEEIDSIIPIEEDGRFGMSFSGKNVVIFSRKVYSEDTAVRIPKTGEMKLYKSGEFGPWDKPNACYFATIQGAYRWVFTQKLREKVKKKGEEKGSIGFKEVYEAIQDAKNAIKFEDRA